MLTCRIKKRQNDVFVCTFQESSPRTSRLIGEGIRINERNGGGSGLRNSEQMEYCAYFIGGKRAKVTIFSW